MATAAVEVLSSNRMLPGSHALDPVLYPRPTDLSQLDAESVVTGWLSLSNDHLQSGASDLSKVFLSESYWRDLLCLTWDFHTLSGRENISSILKAQSKGSRITSLAIDQTSYVGKPTVASVDFGGTLKGIQSFLTVETDVGRGRGLVRLVQDPDDGGKWKAFTLFTSLKELKGYEEFIEERRPTGVIHGSHPGRKNWKERRDAEVNFEDGLEPSVIIVGSGQGGLTAAARLKQLGIVTLMVDQNPHVGDNWRNRYHQLVLHDAVWYDNMPYLDFPPNWPVFTPKDKLAEWFEIYVKAMELNVWNSTTLTEAIWNEKAKHWTVTLTRDMDGKKSIRTFHPRHIIQATGASGEANFPSTIPGLSSFHGPLVHSSQFVGPQSAGAGKKAIIVGSCNSAHDIAQDYLEHGYAVTMVQRSSTLVVTSRALIDVTMAGVYCEGGPPVEDADLISHSLPSPVLKRFHIDATRETTRRDATLLQGLQAAGFALDNGPDGAGLWMKYMHRGGGYYIDVGASQLIADGKIRVKQGQEISHVNEHSMTFADGEEIEADEIVFATGYQNMRETARKIFGDKVADQVGDVWGYDQEGELRTIWRRSGHEGFWFFGGNLALCRYYSRLLALQIKALEVGLMKYTDA
ncbi:hypothetical protein MMC26_001790 [Xylographa opegraphella]|nr:hypothetical protein [Xylographa opegraphella]